MGFWPYLKQLLRVLLPAYVVLGVVVGALLLSTSGVEGNLDITLDGSAVEGLLVAVLLPAVLALLTLLLSPLSYLLSRLASRLLGD